MIWCAVPTAGFWCWRTTCGRRRGSPTSWRRAPRCWPSCRRAVPRPRPVDPAIYELLGATLRAAAPAGAPAEPVVVVVSDGPGNVAYYEHAQIADNVGVPLLTPAEVQADEERAGLP